MHCDSTFLPQPGRIERVHNRHAYGACQNNSVTVCAHMRRQAEITDFMRARGYDYVIQDRTGSKFTIGNITFFRSNKLCCTWHDDRSRVLITAFKLLADVHGDKGSTAEADKLVASARRTHAQVDTAESAATETAAPNVDAGDAVGAGDETGVGEAAEILVANCHLEGNPWKAQARFNQIRKAVAHMQRHIEAERRPVDDARILIAGTKRLASLDAVSAARVAYSGIAPGSRGWAAAV